MSTISLEIIEIVSKRDKCAKVLFPQLQAVFSLCSMGSDFYVSLLCTPRLPTRIILHFS